MKRAFVAVVGLLGALLAGACGEDSAPHGSQQQAPVCLSDQECAPGSCDPFRGCVDCRTSAQCASGERCLGGSCQELQSCESDQECSEGQHCDSGSLTCVECVTVDHCQQGAACVQGACQPASFCSDVAGCRLGTVCDLEQGRCVECLGNLDCGSGRRCVDQRCTTSCESSAACAVGLVCDPLLHICAECVTTDDCAASEHCAKGRCELDVCVPGTGTCQGSQGIVLCGSAGDRATPLYCGKHAACVGEPGEASCSDWVCKPGITTCNADERHLETCSPDGLSVMASVDCNETNQACVGSVCVDIICEPGETTCDAASNSLNSCSSNGTVETVTPCTATQYCDPDSLGCLEKICTPGAVTCVGEQVGTCDELGGDYASLEDCETDETCVNGACTPIICDPLDQLCGDDGNAYGCSANGTTLTLLDTCELPGESSGGGEAGIGYGQHCQDHGAQAGCYSDPCVKGQPYCNDNHVATCKLDGTGPVDDGLDCGADAVCVTSGGPHCAPKVCTPSTKFCEAGSGDVYNCNSDGTLSYLWDDCSAAEYCDAAAGTCKTKVCTPNVAGCSGNVAATCNADGSGWLAGGTNCSATGDACDGGVCKDVVCTPQGYLCKSGNVHQCNALGTGDALYQTCSADYHCVSGNQYCSYDVCTQSQPGCNGTVATTCNTDGSAWSAGGTDCSLTDKICDSGTCKAEICNPYAFTCVGGNVERCNALGTATALYDTCASKEYCQEGSSACQPDECTNGVKICADGIPTTCAPDGSGPVPGGTPCTPDKVCLSGNCQLKICEPGEYFCKDGHVNLCVAGGTAGNPYRQCLADEYCDDTTDSCAKRACTGTTKGCQGESYGVCNSDGSAFDAAPVVDCLASGNLCTRTGCATSALDVLGGTDGSYRPELTHVYGNVIYTTASRKLTKLELSARTTAVGSTIHWIIYRSDTVNGTYTPVYDITAPGAAAGLQPVDVSFTVDANAFYYIAVLFKGPQPTTTLRTGTVIGGAISFARPVSSMFHWTDGDRNPPASFMGPTWHNQTLPLYMRITSVLP